MLQGCTAGYTLPALNLGRFAVANNACCLVISVACSYFGARYWGLPGAATGSVAAFVISESWSLAAVGRALGVSPLALLPWPMLGATGLATGGALAAVALLPGELAASALPRLALKGVAFVAVFAAVFFAAGGGGQLRMLSGAVPLPARFRSRGKGLRAPADELNG